MQRSAALTESDPPRLMDGPAPDVLGYASPQYAQSLAEFGAPFALRACGGHVLLRGIAGEAACDAMACYPMFCCTDWSALAESLNDLPPALVSLTMVADSFCPVTPEALAGIFDLLRPLRQHYLVDLTIPLGRHLSRHHARKLRRAATAGLEIARVSDVPAFADAWADLYQNLIARKNVSGLRAFSRASFRQQAGVPGSVIFAAHRHGELIGADWYMHDGDRVYAHLSAYTEQGYALSVSYLLMATALEHFAQCASRLDLGGAPRYSSGDSSGQAHFKAGWATHTVTAWLCGKVLDAQVFTRLNGGLSPLETAYFPWYRRGEFA